MSFGLDGQGFEIDLSTENAAALRGLFSGYVAPARRITGRRATGAGGRRARRAHPAEEVQQVREWARGQGFEVADRGRVSAEVLAAYRARTPSAARPGPVDDQAAVGARPGVDMQPGTGASDEQVLAWHEAKGYKIPADRKVNGLMRHRYRTAHVEA